MLLKIHFRSLVWHYRLQHSVGHSFNATVPIDLSMYPIFHLSVSCMASRQLVGFSFEKLSVPQLDHYHC